MITYKKGDLLQSNCGIIVHGCNCQGKMGTGIAKSIKTLYPEVYEKYVQLGTGSHLLGTTQWIVTNDTKRLVVNAFTQEYYGRDKRYTSYDAMDNCMIQINQKLSTINSTNMLIGMGKIGCVNAGGCWNVVKEIIDHRLNNFNVEVYEL